MIGYGILTFSYDPDGHLIFPLTVWITEMGTEILLGMGFWQKQVSGNHLDLPEVDIKNTPMSICYGNFHKTIHFPLLSQIF